MGCAGNARHSHGLPADRTELLSGLQLLATTVAEHGHSLRSKLNHIAVTGVTTYNGRESRRAAHVDCTGGRHQYPAFTADANAMGPDPLWGDRHTAGGADVSLWRT